MKSVRSKLRSVQTARRPPRLDDGRWRRPGSERAGGAVVSFLSGNSPAPSDKGQQASELLKRMEGAAGLRIVVVEDEVLISMEIEDLLTDMGAEVVGTALNAEQAIRLAETMSPDCMTMDINIQGPRDGVSAAIEIYERFGIRSVFVSAYGNPEMMDRARPAHPLAWVSKPIDRAELEAALSAAQWDQSDG